MVKIFRCFHVFEPSIRWCLKRQPRFISCEFVWKFTVQIFSEKFKSLKLPKFASIGTFLLECRHKFALEIVETAFRCKPNCCIHILKRLNSRNSARGSYFESDLEYLTMHKRFSLKLTEEFFKKCFKFSVVQTGEGAEVLDPPPLPENIS